MSEKELNFKNTEIYFGSNEENLNKSDLVREAEKMESKIRDAISINTEMTKGKYAHAVAEILYIRFSENRGKFEPEYIICEAVAIAIASSASLDYHFAQYEEKFLREDIRSKLNILIEEHGQ